MAKTTTILAQAGLGTKGIVYILMGILAAFTIFGMGQKADSTDVLLFISQQAFGKILLVAVGVGLGAYSLYRFYQAIKGTDDWGNDLRGLGVRAGFFLGGFIYSLITFSAFKIFLRGNTDNQQTSLLIEQVLDLPYGRAMLYIVSASILGRAIFDATIGWSKLHKKKISDDKLNETGRKVLTRVARIGFSARAIVFAIIAFLIFRAAYFLNPDEAGGTKEAFSWLQNTLGTVAFSFTGLGLVAYGFFMLIRARYPHMDI